MHGLHGERPPLVLQLVMLGKHLDYLLERRLASRGLNRTQSVVLTVLTHRPGLQPLELCGPTGVEPANVTRTLQSLERQGLLERKPHPTDRRAHLLYVTESGQTLAQELSREMRAISASLLEEVDPEERPHLEKLLSSLWKAVHIQLAATGHPQEAAQARMARGGNGNAQGLHFMSHSKRSRAEG